MLKPIVINLEEEWDEKLLNHPKMIELIKLIKETQDYRNSWLLESMERNEIWKDEELDEILINKYGSCDNKKLYYYYIQLGCHIYSLFIATFLSLKYPEIEWRIIYFPDHYLVMKKEDIENKKLVMYDFQAHIIKECKLVEETSYWLYEDWFEEITSIKTIEEQKEMLINEEYY